MELVYYFSFVNSIWAMILVTPLTTASLTFSESEFIHTEPRILGI